MSWCKMVVSGHTIELIIPLFAIQYGTCFAMRDVDDKQAIQV